MGVPESGCHMHPFNHIRETTSKMGIPTKNRIHFQSSLLALTSPSSQLACFPYSLCTLPTRFATSLATARAMSWGLAPNLNPKISIPLTLTVISWP